MRGIDGKEVTWERVHLHIGKRHVLENYFGYVNLTFKEQKFVIPIWKSALGEWLGSENGK